MQYCNNFYFFIIIMELIKLKIMLIKNLFFFNLFFI